MELAAVDAWSLKYGTMLERPEREKDDGGLLLQTLTQIRAYWGLDGKDCSVLVFGPGADTDFLERLKTGETTVGRPEWTSPLGRDEGSIFSFGLAAKEFKEVPVRLNMLPLELRPKPSRISRYVMIALCAVLVISGAVWLGGGIVKNRAMAEKIDTELSRLGDEIAMVEKNRQQCLDLVRQIEILQGIQGRSPRTLDIMRELTERIPKDAWLTEIRIAEDSVIISGNAETATQLIPLLEDSPLFGDVAFQSPVSKTREGKERFRIRLKVI
jgi:general secretion pathway protein L